MQWLSNLKSRKLYFTVKRYKHLHIVYVYFHIDISTYTKVTLYCVYIARASCHFPSNVA